MRVAASQQNVVPSSVTTTVPAVTDWLAVSKTLAIEAVFLAGAYDIFFLHDTDQTVVSLVISTGIALGVLRVSDIVANMVNVKSFLNKPESGVVPQAIGTRLITTQTNGHSNNAQTTQ